MSEPMCPVNVNTFGVIDKRSWAGRQPCFGYVPLDCSETSQWFMPLTAPLRESDLSNRFKMGEYGEEYGSPTKL